MNATFRVRLAVLACLIACLPSLVGAQGSSAPAVPFDLSGEVVGGFTGTFSDGGAFILVLDQAPGGQMVGHVVAMSGNYVVEGALQPDGTLLGTFVSEANSFFRFRLALDPNGTVATLDAEAVDFTGRPIGAPGISTRLARVSWFGRAPASPLPRVPGQVPGIPDAVVLPPPASFVPGVRIVYFLGAASIAHSRAQAIEDPSCASDQGLDCYYLPSNGKWYRVRQVQSLGSIGMLQLDLLHLDDDTCVARTTHYGLDPLNGLVSFHGSDGFMVRGGACGEFWIPPGRLLVAAASNPTAYDVFHGPYELGGRAFEAVRLGASGLTGGHQTYQVSTGLLIVGSDRATGTSLTIDPGNIIRPSAIASHLAYTQYLSTRYIGGFTGEPLPAYVRQANRLVYTCSSLMSLPGVPDVEIACAQEAYIVESGTNWAKVRTVQHDPNTATGRTFTQEADSVVTSGSPGGIFASPSILAGLEAGQAIDFDPHAGTTTFVGYRDEAVVTIVEQGQLHRRELTYDLGTGWLAASEVRRTLSPLTTVVRAVLVAVE